MSHRPLRTVALGVAVSATLLASACGSSDSSAPTTTVSTTTAASSSKGALKITGAWARTSPAAVTAGAAYLQIANPGDVDDALLSASVDATIATKVELHETTMAKPAEKGSDSSMATTAPAGSNSSMPKGSNDTPVMKMSPVDRIEVPAGKTTTLKPGGYHIMMLGLVKPLELGSTLDLTLTFEKAGEVKTTAKVRNTAVNIRRVPMLLLAALALASAAGTVASCATTSSGSSTVTSTTRIDARTIKIVVPRGTDERVDNERYRGGEEVDVMPALIRLRVGDTLLIRNDDWADMAVGPYFVKAGKEVRLTYGKAGEFEGSCAITKGKQYRIVVTA